MITIDDLTTPAENIANWVEDHRPAPSSPIQPALVPAPTVPDNHLIIHFAVDPYEFMKTVIEAIHPFEDAFHAVNAALHRWRALYCPPTPVYS